MFIKSIRSACCLLLLTIYFSILVNQSSSHAAESVGRNKIYSVENVKWDWKVSKSHIFHSAPSVSIFRRSFRLRPACSSLQRGGGALHMCCTMMKNDDEQMKRNAAPKGMCMRLIHYTHTGWSITCIKFIITLLLVCFQCLFWKQISIEWNFCFACLEVI